MLASGEHGFDPMGFLPKFCGTPEKLAIMKEKEIKNGTPPTTRQVVCLPEPEADA